MIFTHLPAVANFIRRTHESFAGLPVDNALTVLGNVNANMMDFPAMVGATSGQQLRSINFLPEDGSTSREGNPGHKAPGR